MGIEPTTSSLPRRCSTSELPGQERYGQTRDLPSTAPRAGDRDRTGDIQLGRLTLYQLSYSRDVREDRVPAPSFHRTSRRSGDGGWWIRTTVGKRRQIYSLLPLATRATLRNRFTFSEPLRPASVPGPTVATLSWRWDSNPQPPAYKAGALPLSYASRCLGGRLVRVCAASTPSCQPRRRPGTSSLVRTSWPARAPSHPPGDGRARYVRGERAAVKEDPYPNVDRARPRTRSFRVRHQRGTVPPTSARRTSAVDMGPRRSWLPC